MAIGKQLKNFDITDFNGGCNYTDDPLSLAPNESPNSMNMEYKGPNIECRDGRTKLTQIPTGDKVQAMFLYSPSFFSNQVIIHAGEKVYTMEGITGVLGEIRSSGTTVEKSRFAQVKQTLIHTFNDYSDVYYWDGVATEMELLSADAPGFKHAVEFQGFLLGGNTFGNTLRIYYEDINTIVDGSYLSYLTLTGGRDEEITSFFTLSGRLYCSTNNRIFRISYIGGVAVFQYKEVVSDIGVIADTVQTVTTAEFGQVAMFIGQDMRMYIFDGAFVKEISQKYYKANDDTDIAMEYLSSLRQENYASIYDTIEGIYRVCVTKKGSETNYYMLNVNPETFAYYPHDNMPFTAMVIAEDGAGVRRLLAGDSLGGVYKVFDKSNSDAGTAIVETFEFPPLIDDPSAIRKIRSVNMYFKPMANYSLILEDKVDFDSVWRKRTTLPMHSSRDKYLGTMRLATTAVLASNVEVLKHSVNIPTTQNMYRMRIRRENDGNLVCGYREGTVSGTGGTASITGSGTQWDTAIMTADNGYYIWIKNGSHANELYPFTATSAAGATVPEMAAGDFVDVEYEVFRANCAACMAPWKLFKVEVLSESMAIGKGGSMR